MGTMLLLSLLTVLIASTNAVPRSRGDPLHVARQQQHSQANFQVNVPYQQIASQPVAQGVPYSYQQQPHVATFQVNPNTLQHQRVEIPYVQQNVQQQAHQGRPLAFNQLQHQQNLQEQANLGRPQTFNHLPNQQNAQQQANLGRPLTSNQFPNYAGNPSSQNYQQLNPKLQPTYDQSVNNALPRQAQELANRLIKTPPGGALLIGSYPPTLPIEKRLISNYTKLRSHVVDTFRCSRDQQPNYVGYGYYADVDNDCQIFHICLPWQELYPTEFSHPVTYQYSFICPNQTVFTQDTLTCTWKSEAVACSQSPQLYWLNRNFFRVTDYEETAYGKKVKEYAQINTPIDNQPLLHDYQIHSKQ